MSLATLVARGVAAVRARWRVVLAVYAVQLAVALLFTAAVALALARVYGERPLFARGVAGDDVALVLALQAHPDVPRTLLTCGLALLAGWVIASWYLTAGLLGALAGRGFGATAAALFGRFARLALWSLGPWILVAAAALAGRRAIDFQDADLRSFATLVGRPLLGYAPALALAALTSLAIDLARAELVVAGGGAAWRALLRGFGRALTRPTLVAHFLLYGAAWLAVSALYVAITMGRDFAGAGGAWLLLGLRQATSLARFLLRALTSAGQIVAIAPAAGREAP